MEANQADQYENAFHKILRTRNINVFLLVIKCKYKGLNPNNRISQEIKIVNIFMLEDHVHCSQLLSRTNGVRCYLESKSVKFATPISVSSRSSCKRIYVMHVYIGSDEV